MRPAAVVFDCDGVLVDSEPHSVRSWCDVLRGLGHPGTEDDVAACVGLGFIPTRAALAKIAPLPPSAQLWPLVMDALGRSFDMGLATFPDSMVLLDSVQSAGLPVAVASASHRERLDLTLAASGLDGRFSVSVAGDEVAAGKPAPDGYLRALDELGIPAGSAVAIEDSLMGVLSAQAAGMAVVAVVRDEAARGPLVSTGAIVVDRLVPSVLGL